MCGVLSDKFPGGLRFNVPLKRDGSGLFHHRQKWWLEARPWSSLPIPGGPGRPLKVLPAGLGLTEVPVGGFPFSTSFLRVGLSPRNEVVSWVEAHGWEKNGFKPQICYSGRGKKVKSTLCSEFLWLSPRLSKILQRWLRQGRVMAKGTCQHPDAVPGLGVGRLCLLGRRSRRKGLIR